MLETSNEALGERVAFAGSHRQSIAGTVVPVGSMERRNKGIKAGSKRYF